jgi:glycosyltransferase involved in cell wall biosynthesis
MTTIPGAANKVIVWHSNPPFAPTGYGQQTAIWLPRIAGLGYDIIVSAFSNLSGSPLTWENKYRVMPAGQDPLGVDVLEAHCQALPADLAITLLDCWPMDGVRLSRLPLACWIPIDTDTLGDGDKKFLDDSGAIPIAMSKHGEKHLKKAGFDALYIPHAIDTAIFKPLPNRDENRERAGLDGKFVIGINSANKDAVRKSFYPQFEAFARFRRTTCPEAVLVVHALSAGPTSPDLRRMAEELDIAGAVKFSDQLRYLMGMFSANDMAAWYNMLDVMSNTSMGEGFGIGPVEALACGVPTIVTNTSAMPELAIGKEWLVEGEPFWNPTHNSRWLTPYIGEIEAKYRMAYEISQDAERTALVAKQAREKALRYDADLILGQHWKPALAEIFNRLERRSASGATPAPIPVSTPPKPMVIC